MVLPTASRILYVCHARKVPVSEPDDPCDSVTAAAGAFGVKTCTTPASLTDNGRDGVLTTTT